jgi:isochorismate hydrolase
MTFVLLSTSDPSFACASASVLALTRPDFARSCCHCVLTHRCGSSRVRSAFFDTSLAATLTAEKIDTLVITGLTTSGCVRATCVDAMSNAFIPIVVREAVGDRAPEPHEANLFDMSAKYGDVIGEDEAITYFRRLDNSGTASRR